MNIRKLVKSGGTIKSGEEGRTANSFDNINNSIAKCIETYLTTDSNVLYHQEKLAEYISANTQSKKECTISYHAGLILGKSFDDTLSVNIENQINATAIELKVIESEVITNVYKLNRKTLSKTLMKNEISASEKIAFLPENIKREKWLAFKKYFKEVATHYNSKNISASQLEQSLTNNEENYQR